METFQDCFRSRILIYVYIYIVTLSEEDEKTNEHCVIMETKTACEQVPRYLQLGHPPASHRFL